MLVNLINTAYCAMKILPWQEDTFSKYRAESVQKFRFALSEEIRREVFLCHFAAGHRKWHKIEYPYESPETAGSAAML